MNPISAPFNRLDYFYFPQQELIQALADATINHLGKAILPNSQDSIACNEIEVVTREGIWCYYFNIASGMLEAKDFKDKGFLYRYTNYQRVGQYLVPFEQTGWFNGVIFASSTSIKVNINPALDSSTFNAPTER